MKHIITTYGSFRTGEAVADAVMRYGLALARSQKVDLIEVPCINQAGTTEHLEMTIGWLVDLGVLQGEDDAGDFSDDALVDDLNERARVIQTAGDPFGPGRPAWRPCGSTHCDPAGCHRTG